MAHQIPPNVPKYIGTQDPIDFIQLYTTSVQVTGGAVNVMANWLPPSTKWGGPVLAYEPPPTSIGSWQDLCD